MLRCLYLLFVYGSLSVTVACNTKSTDDSSINNIVKVDTSLVETKSKEKRFSKMGWTEITTDSHTILDIKYATSSNFVEEVIYPCGRCFLTKDVAAALNKAQYYLRSNYNLGIKLFDCYRPAPAQQRLWDKMPNASYVTPPSKGSMHNRGMAVDITLVDSSGLELDMGTGFDHFGKEAHTDNLLLPDEVLRNRKILNGAMSEAGFKGIRTEWWHFSYQGNIQPVAEWEWPCDGASN